MSTSEVRSDTMLKKVAIGVIGLIALVGVIGALANDGEPGTAFSASATPAALATSAPTERPTAEPVPEPTPEEVDTLFNVGEPVVVTEDGQEWATIVVTDVKQAKGFGDYDRPEVKGNVYITAKVTYEALTDGVDYNPLDWQVFVDGEAGSIFTFVMDGPKPNLSSGTLPEGRKASGYVVYEVPPEGEVRMSYVGNMFSDEGPVFEVILREG